MNTPTPAYQGPLLSVYQWQQPISNGTEVTFERCVRPDTVAILAFLDKDTLLLTREKQVGRTDVFTDAPGGRVDPGETAEEAARRELREETGYEASRLTLWETTRYAGLVTFNCSVFVATGLALTKSPHTHDLTEDITVLETPFEEAYQLSLRNGLRRTEVMLALLRMKHDPDAHIRFAELF
jgi:ADP-ribose pyrophosphatase